MRGDLKGEARWEEFASGLVEFEMIFFRHPLGNVDWAVGYLSLELQGLVVKTS